MESFNFAALMSQEISKAKPASSSSADGQPTKYLKRAELEKQREAAYRAEQQALQATKQEKLAQKRKMEEEEVERARVRAEKRARLAEESRRLNLEQEAREERARRRRLGLPELEPSKDDERRPDDEEAELDDAELVTRLRRMGEPVQLFGETHKQKIRRYRRLVTATTSGFTTLEPVPEEDMKVDQVPTDPEGKRYLYRQLASYFTMVLKEWDATLAARPTEVKESFQGKAATNALVQSRENMKPLFRKFEKGDLDILDAVVEIVKAAQERRYVDANDAYLRLSIGKA